MDALSQSSIGSLRIWKPFPSSSSHQRRPSVQIIACRATKVSQDNLYKILSLNPNSATMDEIKRAYRSMALRYHPDVCHDASKKEELTRMFVQLNAAYETLSSARLRQEYDDEEEEEESSTWRRHRWQEQLAELKRRSHRRREAAQKGSSSSWGSRMRSQNMQDYCS